MVTHAGDLSNVTRLVSKTVGPEPSFVTFQTRALAIKQPKRKQKKITYNLISSSYTKGNKREISK